MEKGVKHIEEINNAQLHQPIVIRKGTKHCTKKVHYSIANYLSYTQLLPSYRVVLTNINNIEIPTMEEALSTIEWKKVMDEEMEALEKNNTWELIELSKGKKVAGCK